MPIVLLFRNPDTHSKSPEKSLQQANVHIGFSKFSHLLTDLLDSQQVIWMNIDATECDAACKIFCFVMRSIRLCLEKFLMPVKRSTHLMA